MFVKITEYEHNYHCLVEKSSYNQKKIKIHEFTRSEKENDRTHHIEITNANTGPVFLTFRNKHGFKSLIDNLINKKSDIFYLIRKLPSLFSQATTLLFVIVKVLLP